MTNFEIPLDIQGVKIEKVKINTKVDIIIYVKSTVKDTICRKCGKKISKIHGYDKKITLRHLSILGRKTFIRICLARYECSYCDSKPTTTQKLPWYNQRSSHTKAYEDHVLLQIVSSTVEDTNIKEGLGYGAVMGIIRRHIGDEVNWDSIEKLDIIGMDEISLKKGHKDFVTIVTGRTGKNIKISFNFCDLRSNKFDPNLCAPTCGSYFVHVPKPDPREKIF